MCSFITFRTTSYYLNLLRHTVMVNMQLLKHLIVPLLLLRPNEALQIGIFLSNPKEADANGILKQWTSNGHFGAAGGVKILTEVPKNVDMPPFSDSIIYLDAFNESTSARLEPLMKQSKIWPQESRYFFVVTGNGFTGDEHTLRHYVKLLWTDAKLLNFLVVLCNDSSHNLQASSYNPFKDEHLNFTTPTSAAELFPNKLRNLHGYPLNVSYVISKGYVYKRNDKLMGIDYDFATTFLRTINASVKLTEKPTYTEAGDDVFYGSTDVVASAMFMYEHFMDRAVYPHGFIDNVVLIPKPRKAPPLATLAQIFDVYTWTLIVATLAVFKGLKLVWAGARGEFGAKILTIAFAIFSIIVMQVIQSLITTFLIYPKPTKTIDTIKDLVDSRMPIHVLKFWQPHLTTQLADQYVLENEDYIGEILNGTALDGGYAIPNVKVVWKEYHKVQEPIGSHYMAFYVGHRSPYKAALNDAIFRALAYGFYSKEWGAFEEAAPPKREKKKFKSLNLSHFDGVFRAWAIGICSSFIAFAGEVLWYHWVLRQP